MYVGRKLQIYELKVGYVMVSIGRRILLSVPKMWAWEIVQSM
jgi:hypothetical protein